jgi:23S rRNA (adenine2503-C2)-methyltransferase
VIDLSEHTLCSLAAELSASGLRPSHSGALLRSFYRSDTASGSNERRFPPELEQLLRESIERRKASLAARQVASDGTAKLLIRLADGRTVEAVLIPGHRTDRAAGCVSTQVGCAMGCDFCATAKAGFERNLTSGEIVEQFLMLRQESGASRRRLQTIVFMGMGEPMLNLGNVLPAIERMASNDMGGIGCGQITVSTVGIVPGIEELAASGLDVGLAVSLHAPDDQTRARLLPAGRRFGVEEILEAADRYQAATRRPVSVQYCLLKGVNDSAEQADELARLLKRRRMHVNLLRYNSAGEGLTGEVYEAASEEATDSFLSLLRGRGVVAHLRQSRGPDIDAACGQLRQRA